MSAPIYILINNIHFSVVITFFTFQTCLWLENFVIIALKTLYISITSGHSLGQFLSPVFVLCKGCVKFSLHVLSFPLDQHIWYSGYLYPTARDYIIFLIFFFICYFWVGWGMLVESLLCAISFLMLFLRGHSFVQVHSHSDMTVSFVNFLSFFSWSLCQAVCLCVYHTQVPAFLIEGLLFIVFRNAIGKKIPQS